MSLILGACGGGSNAPPTAGALSLATTEDTTASGLLVAADPDGDTVTITVSAAPGKGTVSFSPTAPLSFSYVPQANVNGADSFSYVVTDKGGATATATVTITIAAVNDSPSIAGSLATDEDQPANAVLVSEPEGDSFTASIATPPAHGTLTPDGAPGRFRYTPAPDFNGVDSFELAAEDASAARSTKVVAVTVRPVNDAPVARADTFRGLQNTPVVLTPLANDTDVDGDVLTVRMLNVPAGVTATVNANGSILYTPPAAFIGTVSFQYEIRDGAGLTSTSTFDIASSMTQGVLYLSGATASAQKDLYFFDGIRRLRVNAPLQMGETIDLVVPATKAPVVFYRSSSTAGHRLSRVDLRLPQTVNQVDASAQGPGIYDLVINEAGTRAAYNVEGHLRFAEFSGTTTLRDLGPSQSRPILNASGSRAFYLGLFTQLPYSAYGALFSIETSGASAPRQITQTATPPDSVGPIIYLARDERRLYYFFSPFNAPGRTMAVNPESPGSEVVVHDSATLPLGWNGVTQDESAYLSRTLQPREDYYLASSTGSFSPRNLTVGTSSGPIYDRALAGDASRFYYSRADSSGLHANLYGVDTQNPLQSIPIGGVLPATYYGVQTLKLSPDARRLTYATIDIVPFTGGSFVTGASDLRVLDTQAADTSVLVKHFVGTAQVWEILADSSFAMVIGGPDELFVRDIYALNLRDTTQLLRISEGFAEVPQLVPNFAN